VLGRYGIIDAAFDPSNREHQDRFVEACLSTRRHRAG
jgi:hypothetical protein